MNRRRLRTSRPAAPAQINFRAQAELLTRLDLADRFRHIYETNLWGSSASHSGPGSDLVQTAQLRAALPGLLRRLQAESMLDIPCGDAGWMSQTDLGIRRYIGADIVAQLIERNRALYPDETGLRREFLHLDLIHDDLPQADLVFCRDCLVHFSFENIFAAFRNLRRSGSRYLLTTTFIEQAVNSDIVDGDWRVINFERPPFCLTEPLTTIIEGCQEQAGAFADKAMCLWLIANLPDGPQSLQDK